MQPNAYQIKGFRAVDAVVLVLGLALFWPGGVAMAFPGIPLAEGAFWVSVAGGIVALALLSKHPGRVAVVLAAWLPFSDLSAGVEVPVQAQILPLALCAALAGRTWWDGYRLRGFNARIFALGVGWMVFSALLSERTGHSLLSLMAWAAPFAAFFCYLQSARWAGDAERKAELRRLILAAATSAVVLLAYAALWSPFPGKAAIRPFFLDANFFSVYLCLVLPGLIWVVRSAGKGSAKRFLALGMAAIMVAALVALRSRGAWMGLGGGLLLALFFWLDNWVQRSVMLVGGLVMALVFAGIMRQYLDERPALPGDVRYVLSAGDLQADFSNRERLMRWTCAGRMGQEKIVWGHGPGSFAPKFKHYLKSDEEVRQISYWFGWTGGAHSVWLTSLAETGAVGLILLLGLLGGFVWDVGRKRKHAGRGAAPGCNPIGIGSGRHGASATQGFSGAGVDGNEDGSGAKGSEYGYENSIGLLGLVAVGSWAVAGIFNDLMMVGPLAGMLGVYFGAMGGSKARFKAQH